METQTIFVSIVHIMAILAVLTLFQWILWKLIMKKARGKSFTVTMYLLTILGATLAIIPAQVVAYGVFIWFKNYILAEGAVPYETGGPKGYLWVAVIITVIWVGGILWTLLKSRCVIKYLWHNARVGEPLPENLQRIFDEESERMGVAGMVTAQMNRFVQSPQVIHYGKNNVVQFPVVDEISELDFRVILKHELYHVKHRDYIWRQFMNILFACTWFNPASLSFINDLDFWMDVCRDAEVVHGGIVDVDGYYGCIARYIKAHDRKMAELSMTLSVAKKKNHLLERRNLLLRMAEAKTVGRFSVVTMMAVFILGATVSTWAGTQLVQRAYIGLYEVVAEQIDENTTAGAAHEMEEVLSDDVEYLKRDILLDSELNSWMLAGNEKCASVDIEVRKGDKLKIQGFISQKNAQIKYGYVENGIYKYCIRTSSFNHGFTINTDGSINICLENISEVSEASDFEVILFVMIE